MTKQAARDEFIATLTRELKDTPTHHVTAAASKLMRYAATYHRLAEAECNGDWPYDNGERKVHECTKCGSYVVRSTMLRDATQSKDEHGYRPLICKGCRIEQLAAQVCEPLHLKPVFQGDPRGCVLKVQVPSGYTNDWGREGVCVPS